MGVSVDYELEGNVMVKWYEILYTFIGISIVPGFMYGLSCYLNRRK